jgi:hypothetical protein
MKKRSHGPFAFKLGNGIGVPFKANAFCELFASYWRLIFFFNPT